MSYTQEDIQSIEDLLLTVSGYPDTVTVDEAIAELESNGTIKIGSSEGNVITITTAQTVYGLGGDDTIDATVDGVVAYGGSGSDTFVGPVDGTLVIGDFELGTDIVGSLGYNPQDAGATLTTVYDGNGTPSTVITLESYDPIADYTSTSVIRLAGITEQQYISSITVDGVFYGSENADRIIYGAKDAAGDAITTGNDIVYAGKGNDYVNVYLGNDTVYGGDGNDTIVGVTGNNVLYGDAGNDTIDSGILASKLYGGEGNDILKAVMAFGGGHEMTGGNGADTFMLRATNGTVPQSVSINDFKMGVDQLVINGETVDLASLPAGMTFEAVNGGSVLNYSDKGTIYFKDIAAINTSDGIISGSGANDYFALNYGDAGGDVVTAGDDLIYANGGADYINVNGGNDVAYGGDGNDSISGVTGYNSLYGDAGDDIIDSGLDDSKLYGGDGNDLLKAAMVYGGGHELTGGAGADTFELRATQGTEKQFATILDYEEGVDTIVIAGATIDLNNLSAGMTLEASVAGTILHYSANGNLLLQDIYYSHTSDGLVAGTGGDDRFTLGVADHGGDVVTTGDDILYGNKGNDYLNAYTGNDTIYGGDDDDTILGSWGHNVLYGDAGNDVIDSGMNSSQLYGGAGDDVLKAAMVYGGGHELTGGAGADTFVFRATHGTAQQSAIITDFDNSVDMIEIAGQSVDLANLSVGMSLEATADGAVLHYADNGSILLQDYVFNVA